MKKKAQEYGILNYQPQLRGKSLEDLYMAIRADYGMTEFEKQQVMSQIRGLVGYAPGSTPLSALMLRGLGGVLGYLISKYFGMGPVGQIISTVAGFGIGSAINNNLNKPPNPFPGWKVM